MLTSQNLTPKEKRLYRYIEAKNSEAENAKLRKNRQGITRKYVQKDSGVSQRIAQDIKAKILEPYRKKHPNADADAKKWAEENE